MTFDLTQAQEKALVVMLADNEIVRDARSESWLGQSNIKIKFATILSLYDRRMVLIRCNGANSRRKTPIMCARLTAVGAAVARDLRSQRRIEKNAEAKAEARQ
jgi:hypothetical protein